MNVGQDIGELHEVSDGWFVETSAILWLYAVNVVFEFRCQQMEYGFET